MGASHASCASGQSCANRLEHRLRTAREHGAVAGQRVGDEHRVDHDLGVRNERGSFGVPLGSEAEHRGWSLERFREIRQRCDPDAAAHEQRPFDVEPETVSERTENMDRLAGLELRERAGARPDRIEQKAKLAGRRETE